MFRSLCAGVLVCCLTTNSLFAADPIEVKSGFDLIPINAAAGFSIHNLKELQAQGDVFIKNTKIEDRFGIRPSQLVQMAFGFLGANKGRDDTIPAGIFLANLFEARVLNPTDFRALEKLIVVAVGVSDVDKMGGNFGFAKGELKPEQILKTSRQGNFGSLIYLKGNHVYLGVNERAILSVARGKRLSEALKKPQIERFSRTDMIFHLGTTAWGAGWVQFVQEAKDHARSLGDKATDPETGLSREMLELIVECLPAVQNVLFGAAIDEKGFDFQAMAVFRPDDHPQAEKLLTLLRGGEKSSTLEALPDQNLIAAQAVRSDGSQNRAFVRAMLEGFFVPWANEQKLFAITERPHFSGLFDEVWQRLNGSQVAFYGNSNPAEEGLFSMLAVLETEDPKEFLSEMRQLVRFAKPGELKLDGKDPRAEDVAAVEKLIEQLGDRSSRVRQSASLKLSLIGAPALPYLDKAVTSRDREVAARARRLKGRIERIVEARRRDVLSQSLLSKISARWGDFPSAETRQGVPIDIIKMVLDEDSKTRAAGLYDTFGPEWSKIRLAVHGKKIVVLFGSNVKLLDETLKNLNTKNRGLAERATLAEFEERAPDNRRTEFHLRLSQLPFLSKAAKEGAPPSKDLTSFSLGIGKETIELHIWVPNEEFRILHRW